MDIIKIILIAFIAVVIILILKQSRPEFAIYASIVAGIIILSLIMKNLELTINLLKEFSNKININQQFFQILLKITGIAILTEFAVSVCKDAGESAVASKVDIGGKVIIISLSIPIIQALLQTVLKVLP